VIGVSDNLQIVLQIYYTTFLPNIIDTGENPPKLSQNLLELVLSGQQLIFLYLPVVQ